MIYLDLTFHLTLLVALGIVAGFIENRCAGQTRLGLLLQGVLFGGATVVAMLRPIELGPGLIFDGRSLMISLCALFFGPWAAGAAGVLTIACRIWLGGMGMITGSLVILSSAGIGLLAHYRLKPEAEPPSAWSLYLFGLAVHLSMLALMFTLPGGAGLTVVMRIGLPVILLFPLTTILAGKILSDQLNAGRAKEALQESEDRYARLFNSVNDAVFAHPVTDGKPGTFTEVKAILSTLLDAIPIPIFYKDSDGRYLGFNRTFEAFFGSTKEQLIGKTVFDINPPELARINHAKDTELFESGGVQQYEAQVRDSLGVLRDVIFNKAVFTDSRGAIGGLIGTILDITERKKAEQDRLAHLRFFECMDQVNRTIQGANDLDQMMGNVLNTMLSIFDCDRAWLFFPCDPDAPTFRVPMEITKPEYPGAKVLNVDMPMSPDIAQNLQEALASDDPVIYIAGTEKPINKVTAEQFGVRSQMFVALYPKLGEPWVFGMHQCSYPRIWTKEEKRLFQETGRRLSDALTSLLILRNLKESEEKYRTLIQKIQAAVVVYKSDMQISTWNHNAEELLGLTQDQLLGKTALDPDWHFFREDGTVMSVEEYPVNQVLAKRQALRNFIVGVHRPDNEKDEDVWVLVNADPVIGKDYNITQVIVTLIDITARKRMERTLEESEAKTRSILDNIGIGVALISPEMEILELNRRMREWFPAIDPGQHSVCYRAFNDPPRERMCDYCPTCKTLQDGLVHEATTQTPQAGGLRNYRIVSSPILNSSGEVTAAIEMVEDITETLSLESQLQQAQKLESIGRLAGGVAHDFNNMLGVILGHTEFAMEEVDPAEPLYAALQEIRKAAERSADLTRQLLAFARKQTVAPKVLDLNETVEGMLRMLRRLIGEDIDLAWLPGKNLWPVKVDPSQIDQILANLCVNARDAIAGVGKVTIEMENATFDEADCADHPGFIPGDFVMLAVCDDGDGMYKDTLDKIFEPFFTTKEIGRGTGLGLATVYGTVKQNHGFISVYSEPGLGTTFKIYLPRHRAMTEQMRKESPAAPVARGHETILIVEDESAILNMTRQMLERFGYRVLSASTPGEAIHMAMEHAGEIHLLIADVVMPEMNGRDLAKNLISVYPGLRRLFMSGYTANVIAHHGVLDEGINFIQKPFSIQALAAKVREVLDSN